VQVLNTELGIVFGAGGNLDEFSPSGFSPTPDPNSRWSEAPVAELLFRLPPLRHDPCFAVDVAPYLAEGRIARQECWIFVNGLFVVHHAIRMHTEITFEMARETINARPQRLSFALPNATSPRELGIGGDLRLLGLAFGRLRLQR
jgi:hypothetical protein